ncbi:ATP-NAD kinase-like domain-containing protein [Ilyonectria destructans]|nr:ATP-NAD kinase-like domain-containing protein [Ilyonectria destructans]
MSSMPSIAGNMTGVLYASSPTALHPALGSPGRDGSIIKSAPVAADGACEIEGERHGQIDTSTTKLSPITSSPTIDNTTSTPCPSPSSNGNSSIPSESSAAFSVAAAAGVLPSEEAIDPVPGPPVAATAIASATAGDSFGGASSSSPLSPSIPAPPLETLASSDYSSSSSSDYSPPSSLFSATLPLSSYSASSFSNFRQGHQRNSPSRDSIPRQTVIKALASVARQHKPDALSLVPPPRGLHSHSRTRSQSRSFSILSGMKSAQGGDEALSEARPQADVSSTAAPSTGVNAATDSQIRSPSSQTLTDALNDIAKSRLTPTATSPTPTPTTAIHSTIAGAAGFPAPSSARGRQFPAADAASAATPTAATTLLPAALQSPCFYHERFADAVDINKVLEEIKNDVSMSHSRLVATATGVREVSKQLQRRPVKRAVRNIMIVTKARDNQLVYLTRELASWLLRTPRYGSDLGVNVYVDAKLRGSRRFDAPAILAENPRFQHMLKYWTPDLCWSQPEKFDLVLTLGGDGTVLFTSWLFQRIVPPVLSFSLGSLGFMTTFEFEKYKEHLNRVMGDDGMKINLRMRFTCTVYRGGLPGDTRLEEGEQFEVLNELVIDRGPSPYVSNLELYGDDELLTVVQADGCIFSTPTGSTAYSLSAGGALVHPDIPAILLTPICPHTLSFRPMVLSDTMALRVSIPRNSRATAYCAFDGKGRLELRQGDHVTITASQYPFPTVTRTDTEWFDSVSRTLRWNVRAAAQKPFDADIEGCADDNQDDLGWDIDTDSAFYGSEEGSVSASPIRRQMSLLGL